MLNQKLNNRSFVYRELDSELHTQSMQEQYSNTSKYIDMVPTCSKNTLQSEQVKVTKKGRKKSEKTWIEKRPSNVILFGPLGVSFFLLAWRTSTRVQSCRRWHFVRGLLDFYLLGNQSTCFAP
uniref:Uncharacterized protein n=1 Tax=Cacopsylla melanoneura TaxID=428564 RepID=A0A8D8M332_9HEMI